MTKIQTLSGTVGLYQHGRSLMHEQLFVTISKDQEPFKHAIVILESNRWLVFIGGDMPLSSRA